MASYVWVGLHSLTLATSHKFHPSPPVEDHGGVMVDVEEGQLTVLLPQDEKYLNTHNTHTKAGLL